MGKLGYYRSRVAVVNGVLIGAVLLYVVARAAFSGGLRFHNAVPTQVSDVVLFAVLTGLVTYGTLEIVKRVVRLRGRVHLSAAQERMGDRACEELNQRLGSPDGVAAAFDLPTDQFAAQVTVAVDAALSDLSVLGLTTSGLSVDRIVEFLPALSPLTAALADPVLSSARRPGGRVQRRPWQQDEPFERRAFGDWIWRRRQFELSQLKPEAVYEALATELANERLWRESEEWNQEESDDEAEFELARAARTGTDQLQIALGEQWGRAVQGAAVWVSGIWGIVLVEVTHFGAADRPAYVLAALLVGGPLSWMFHDLAAALERARA